MDPAILKALFFIALAVVGYFANRVKEKAAGAKPTPPQPVDSFPGSAGRIAPPPSGAASPRAGEAPETEKMRKFFEALGLPKTDLPPAPLAPKAVPPPLPARPVPPRPAPVAARTPPPPRPSQPAPEEGGEFTQPVRSPREALGADLDPALRDADPRFDRGAMAGAVRAAASQSRADFAAIAGDISRAGNVVPGGRGMVAAGRGASVASETSASLARQLVAHPDALRRAVILQELLGPPLALRDPAAPRG